MCTKCFLKRTKCLLKWGHEALSFGTINFKGYIIITSVRTWPLLFLGKLAATAVVIAILGAAALLLRAA